MVRVNAQLGFFPATSPKGKPFLLVFGIWCWHGAGTQEKLQTLSRKPRTERSREHRERKGKVKSRGKMLNVSQC